jgi:hypothetical protein
MPERARLQLPLHGDWPVASEPLAHVDHALFALGVALLQLLALCGERVFQRWSQAVAGAVAFDKDTVAVLQAECKGCSCGVVSRNAQVKLYANPGNEFVKEILIWSCLGGGNRSAGW